ncbi:MAG: DUF839 domain-containing protein [Pseudomonadota bacterium]|nr:DUF839 domain-containing protein [Pseudomonadota bacterium]
MSSVFNRSLSRRAFGRGLIQSAASLAIGGSLLQTSQLVAASASPISIGPLGEPDANGLRLPEGFSSRVVATSGRRVANSLYRWHTFPDGGATFATDDGGWVYVSNSEVPVRGGVGALRFNAAGEIVDAYPILRGTNINCAGGPTPWGTWISCEEFERGYAWECDPLGQLKAIKRPALGMFKHEAVAIDPILGHVYLTEDEPDGNFYRFIAAGHIGERLNLDEGQLQVASVDASGYVNWIDVPNPEPKLLLGESATRHQVADATVFKGGEGIWYHQGLVYFTTKGDNRVWELDTQSQQLAIIYDDDVSPTPILTGVDNVTVSERGSVLVGEDGGDMQIVVLTADRSVSPLVQVVGQDGSEITGPALSPDGSRLYFSSQRGTLSRRATSGRGITYEVTGPFNSIL